MLEMVGIEASMATRFPHELSGGQRQRAAIARALIARPRLVVFDEAVSALDVSAQAQVLNLIKETQAEQRYAALFISHDLAAVRYVADRLAVMYLGAIVAEADAATFYGRPKHPYAVALMEREDDRLALGPPDGLARPTGCALAGRCPYAVDRCTTEAPSLRSVGSQLTACHRAEEL
jgi:oligopeptide/dipeptide ABC transporter ATP-binding protein